MEILLVSVKSGNDSSIFMKTIEVITGLVAKGAGRGRELGVPTLNLPYKGKLSGVFAGVVDVLGRSYKAAVNIGTRPSFNEYEAVCEIHVLDFDEMVPLGTEVKLEVTRKIRDIKKFSSVEELKAQIFRDIDEVRGGFLA